MSKEDKVVSGRIWTLCLKFWRTPVDRQQSNRMLGKIAIATPLSLGCVVRSCSPFMPSLLIKAQRCESWMIAGDHLMLRRV